MYYFNNKLAAKEEQIALKFFKKNGTRIVLLLSSHIFCNVFVWKEIILGVTEKSWGYYISPTLVFQIATQPIRGILEQGPLFLDLYSKEIGRSADLTPEQSF